MVVVETWKGFAGASPNWRRVRAGMMWRRVRGSLRENGEQLVEGGERSGGEYRRREMTVETHDVELRNKDVVERSGIERRSLNKEEQCRIKNNIRGDIVEAAVTGQRNAAVNQ